MERWEYAVGNEGIDGSWTADVDGLADYEAANRALIRAILAQQNTEWLDDPHILRRSDRHPLWTPVKDHTAEVLAEVLEDLRLDFGVFGAGIMQGSDLAKTLKKRAHLLNPNKPTEEYDS